MKFRSKIVDAACLNHFTRVSNMIAKLAKTCTLRIRPDKLNFILADKVANGGVSMWCELEQENFFSEFQMEGVSAENNEIYLELTSENLSRALKTAQNARALKIKLTNKHFPCLTVSIELLSVSSSSRIVTHDIPVKVIPRKLWKDLQEPAVPDSDVSIYLPVLKTMKSVVEKMRNISNHLIIEANLNGDLNLKIETEIVCVTTHFKDLGNPPLASENASQARNPEQMAEVHVDIRKLLQFLAGQQVNPTKAVCRDLGGGRLAGCSGRDRQTLGKSSVRRAQESAKGFSDDQERYVWTACSPSLHSEIPVRAEESQGLHLSSRSRNLPHDGVRVELRANHVLFMSDQTLSCPPGAPTGTEEDLELENPPSSASWEKNILKTASEAVLSVVNGRTQAALDRGNRAHSSDGLPPGAHCTHSLSASQPGPRQPCPLTQCHPGAIPVQGPADQVDPVTHRLPETDTQSPQSLGFQIQMASEAALCLVMDFGDRSGVRMRIRNVSEEMAVTAYHKYGKEGVYVLRAVIYNEFYGTEVELGPYYVEIGHEAVSVFMNSSSVHEDELLVFAGSHRDQKSTVVMHRFPSFSSYNVSFTSQTQVGDSQAWPSITVWYQMQSVSVYTNGTVFSTDTDITFVAVTKETAPLEFVWYFGEDPPVRTTSRSIKKRLGIPQWYRVLVTASNGIGSVASEPHHIRVQRRIVANRLTSTSSALVNASVTFECRINFGTDVAYLWNFGDGAVGLGNSSATHVYSREGEFTVEVLAFNNVSSASLRKQLFIVRQPCQPPPVKNMGPGKVQVWRSQPLKLGVTFEAEVLCDISQGLSYTWSFMNSVGLPVPLPPAISSHGKTITVPSYFLEPGNYTALAKVQVEGSAVHSNYCIGVEVRARAPVSLISEGTHLFISRTPSATIVLSGSSSYDPDEPGAALRYHWKCTAASTPGHTCFPASAPRGLHASAPTLSFAANSLSDSYDQFLVTLMVSSDGRTSSEAQVFLSTRPDLAFRFVHISRVNFKDIFVNWNEELSLQAECEGCGEISNLSYSWDLFLVNATEKNSIEVPFCRTVGLLGSSEFGAVLKLSGSNLPSLEPRRADPYATTTPSSWKPWPETPSQPALSAAGRTSTESTIGMHWAPTAGDPAAPGGAPRNEGSPGPTPSGRSLPPQSLSPHSPDFEAYYSDIQEAMPSKGRQPGHWTNINLPGSGPSASADGSRGDGDNLVGPFLPTVSARPALLVDWPKSVVSRAVFHGYTSSGITEKTVTIKPYSLSPGETYVLQASVGSKHSLLGKAQLYLTVNPAPQDVACQVQPHHGLEAHTVFSVFCMSGRLDFRYEFSYQIGNTSKHTLYRGRDSQYYFALPAGEPLDNYKVMVSTEITDGEGSQVQPCSVAVTVRPRFHGNHCLGEDVYNSSLKNLSTLQLMGSYTETRNYITMITRVLSRWAKEDRSPSCGQWSRIQDALISSVCRLAFTDQLSFTSAVLILKYTQTLLTQSQFSGRFVVDKERMLELILLVSGVLEVSDHEKTRKVDYLREEGIKVISDLLLGCLSSNSERQLHVSTGQMEIRTLLHHDLRSSVQSLGPVQVHLPGELAGQSPAGTGTQSPCYISQLMLFKKNPYPGGRAPSQVGRVLALSLYSCSSRTPISGHRLRKPVTVEFGEEDGLDNRRNKTTFVLLRDKVNFHQFIGLSENPQESLQIRIEFSKPLTRAFPVMLLVRFSEKPTPSDFLVKQIYFWDEQIVHIYIPAVSLRDTNLGYLSLLDADYDRKPPNKYLAKSVNYAVHFQWIQCLFWDTREWKSESFSPQPGTSPEKVNCSYHRLAAFSVARRRLNASFETSDISKLQGHPENLLPGIFIVVFTILYVLLVTKSRRVDHHEKKKTGYIFLQENAPPDHQLYAVVVDTGFRAPARFTAKVIWTSWGRTSWCGRVRMGVSDGTRNTRFGDLAFLSITCHLSQLAHLILGGLVCPSTGLSLALRICTSRKQEPPLPQGCPQPLLPFPPSLRKAAQSDLCF